MPFVPSEPVPSSRFLLGITDTGVMKALKVVRSCIRNGKAFVAGATHFIEACNKLKRSSPTVTSYRLFAQQAEWTRWLLLINHRRRRRHHSSGTTTKLSNVIREKLSNQGREMGKEKEEERGFEPNLTRNITAKSILVN